MRRLANTGSRSTVFLCPSCQVSKTFRPCSGSAATSRGRGSILVTTGSCDEASPIITCSRPAAAVLRIRQNPGALEHEVDAVAAALVALGAVSGDRHQADRGGIADLRAEQAGIAIVGHTQAAV